jgi:hypothetical protein
MRRRLGRILRSPCTAFAAGAVFVASVAALPIGRRSPSVAGQLIDACIGLATNRAGGCHFCVMPYAQTWYAREGTRFIPLPHGQIEDIADPVLVSLDTYRSGPAGLWAPTCSREHAQITTSAASLTPVEAALVRAQFVDELAVGGDPMAIRLSPALRTTDHHSFKVLWLGVLHNAVSLVSFWILARCIAERARARVAARAGLCRGCAYDLRVTPTGAPCPECGRLFTTVPQPPTLAPPKARSA